MGEISNVVEKAIKGWLAAQGHPFMDPHPFLHEVLLEKWPGAERLAPGTKVRRWGRLGQAPPWAYGSPTEDEKRAIQEYLWETARRTAGFLAQAERARVHALFQEHAGRMFEWWETVVGRRGPKRPGVERKTSWIGPGIVFPGLWISDLFVRMPELGFLEIKANRARLGNDNQAPFIELASQHWFPTWLARAVSPPTALTLAREVMSGRISIDAAGISVSVSPHTPLRSDV